MRRIALLCKANMRRNVKFTLILAIVWVFFIFYYIQGNQKVSERFEYQWLKIFSGHVLYKGLITHINWISCFQRVLQNENRALRLRDLHDTSVDTIKAAADFSSNHVGNVFETSSLNSMKHYYFDESNYIRRGSLHAGEDPYIRNRFNQQESDKLPSNRVIPDTRHSM